MKVICIEEEAFFSLVELVVLRLQKPILNDDLWVSPKEAMRMLNIKSKTTLANLRYSGKVVYSQHKRKVIVYNKNHFWII